MKRIFFVVLIAAAAAVVKVGAQEGPADFVFVIGPRLGASYMFAESNEEFREMVSQLYPDGGYRRLTTLFGITLEQRVLLGNTNSHFAFQQLIMVSALEQSIALPSAAFLIGYRDLSGFEVGAGPSISFGGLGVIVAAGWTFSSNGVHIPVDVSVLLPSHDRATSVALTTGFNFVSRRSGRR